MSPRGENTPGELELLKACVVLQTKVDALSQQMFNGSMLNEFMIEKMNLAAAQNDLSLLSLDVEEFQAYYRERFEELQADWKNGMKSQLDTSEQSQGDALDLGE